MIIQIISAFFATISFSIIFNISRYHLVYCGITGAIGWTFYLITLNYLNQSIVIASFFGAFSIALISQVFAKILKTPVSVFLISGIIPLVPGAGMYKTIYYVISDNYSMAYLYGIETFQIAGVIAIAIILIDTFNKILTKSY